MSRGAGWYTVRVGPEHVGLTPEEYDALRALNEGRPEDVRELGAGSGFNPIARTLQARGLVRATEPDEASFPYPAVTDRGLDVLRTVGLFRRRRPPRGPLARFTRIVGALLAGGLLGLAAARALLFLVAP